MNAQPDGDGEGVTTIDTFDVTASLCPVFGAAVGSADNPVIDGEQVAVCITSNDDPLRHESPTLIRGNGSWMRLATMCSNKPFKMEVQPTAWLFSITGRIVPRSMIPATPLQRVSAKFKTDFYDAIGNTATVAPNALQVRNTGTLQGSGTVEMLFSGQRRRARVLLSPGDAFAKEASVEDTMVGRNESEEGDEDDDSGKREMKMMTVGTSLLGSFPALACSKQGDRSTQYMFSEKKGRTAVVNGPFRSSYTTKENNSEPPSIYKSKESQPENLKKIT